MELRARWPAVRARWPAVRAALIALALVIGLIDGCPIPDRKSSPPWARGLAGHVGGVRTKLLQPVAWIGKDLDIQQRWLLFRGAPRKRYRIYLEGKTATGDWQLFYRAGDADYAEYEDLLAYRRVRGTYSPGGRNIRSQYYSFSTWITLRLLDDHPELVVGRTRMERVQIGGGSYMPTGDFSLEVQERRRRK